MDGWTETYYRTEEDYLNDKDKVLPYAVNCKTPERGWHSQQSIEGGWLCLCRYIVWHTEPNDLFPCEHDIQEIRQDSISSPL